MKAFISGVAAALLIAFGAYLVLDKEVQRNAEQAFQTRSVRL